MAEDKNKFGSTEAVFIIAIIIGILFFMKDFRQIGNIQTSSGETVLQRAFGSESF